MSEEAKSVATDPKGEPPVVDETNPTVEQVEKKKKKKKKSTRHGEEGTDPNAENTVEGAEKKEKKERKKKSKRHGEGSEQTPETTEDGEQKEKRKKKKSTRKKSQSALASEPSAENEKEKRAAEIERQIEEAKLKMAKADADLQKQRSAEHKSSERQKSGFFDKIVAQFVSSSDDSDSSSSSSDSDESHKSSNQVSEIGTPMNVKHEGHVGFDKKVGHFETRNLPPAIAKLFDEINFTLHTMGVDEITEKEAKLLLKALPVITDPNMKKQNQTLQSRESSFFDSASTFFHSISKNDEKDKHQKQWEQKFEDERKLRTELERKNQALEIKVLELEAKLAPSSGGDDPFAKVKEKYEKLLADIRKDLDAARDEAQKLKKERDELALKKSISTSTSKAEAIPPAPAPVEDIPPPPPPAPEEAIPDAPPPDAPPPPPDHVPIAKSVEKPKKTSQPAPAPKPEVKSTGVSMDDILAARQKMKAKGTASTPAPSTSPAPASALSPKGSFHEQLQGAITNKDSVLKKVETAPKANVADEGNLASVIARAIVQRRQHLKEAAEDENENDNLEDWM